MKYASLAVLSAALLTTPLAAHEGTHANGHAPIGVMGDHTHNAGEVMFSYRFMHMEGSGNQVGTDSISSDDIVTTVPNRFAGMPGQPPTLRVVPQEMRMEMHMIGMMYAPVDWMTLIASGRYMTREMESTTYQGPVGTTVLGGSELSVDGFGDMVVGALFPLSKVEGDHEIVARAAISIPTGSTTQTGEMLTPMGTTRTMRLAYPMQPGSGTWDLKPAITYRGYAGQIGWGAQYNATIRLGTNDQGYSRGDVHEVTGWVSYEPARWISLSGRLAARTTGRIDGMDPAIMGPNQAANPDFQGGERVDAFFGINLAAQGSLDGQRLGIEIGAPIHQDVNGPQMTGDWSLTVGWQGSF
ncbi:MAG: transporter [Parasphingopyxis sp.]